MSSRSSGTPTFHNRRSLAVNLSKSGVFLFLMISLGFVLVNLDWESMRSGRLFPQNKTAKCNIGHIGHGFFMVIECEKSCGLALVSAQHHMV